VAGGVEQGISLRHVHAAVRTRDHRLRCLDALIVFAGAKRHRRQVGRALSA
jgi:hypothetical protein